MTAWSDAVLKKEAETNERLYNLLLQKAKELALNRQIVTSRISVVDPPSLPGIPISPKESRIMWMAAILGLLGGIGCAFAMEQIDDTIRSSEEIDRKLGLCTLGEVPNIHRLKGGLAIAKPKAGYEFITHDSPRSPVADIIRSLSVTMFLAAPAPFPKKIVMCSSLPGEGKTFLTVAMATAIAAEGNRVLVVDADMRRQGLTRIFDKKSKVPGLSSILTENGLRLESLIKRSQVPGLYYLPAGPTPPNPPGLLKSSRMARLVRCLDKAFDIVIFDTPPVVGLPDGQIVLTLADAAILVARASYVTDRLAEAGSRQTDRYSKTDSGGSAKHVGRRITLLSQVSI